MKDNHKKTFFEKITGKKPFKFHCDSIKNEPITAFISFKEAQTILGHEWRGSTENALKNGSIRFWVISPDCGKVRMIYRPDVIALKTALKTENNAE